MKRINPILAVFLAAMVLLSSTSFMIGLHKCNGEVREVSFLSHADGCNHKAKLPPCHKVEKTSCCEDGDVVHEGSDFSHSNSTVELVAASDETLVVYTDVVISLIIPESAAAVEDFPDYDVPIPLTDRPVANRVLLI